MNQSVTLKLPLRFCIASSELANGTCISSVVYNVSLYTTTRDVLSSSGMSIISLLFRELEADRVELLKGRCLVEEYMAFLTRLGEAVTAIPSLYYFTLIN